MTMSECPFCGKSEDEALAGNELALAFYDAFPVNPGHVLIVPRRHVETLFEARAEELAAICELLFEAKELLEEKFQPDGYNVGFNVGRAGGQTIFHLHMHVIPRYEGDVPDPRGGIRRIKKSLVPYVEEGES